MVGSCGVRVLRDKAPRTMSGGEPSSINRFALCAADCLPPYDPVKGGSVFLKAGSLMYQALYRKYRPKTFEDIVGQEHITVTLAREVERGKISHAYLFTGSRGTGKTSCAKILAKAVNCLNPKNGDPCNECEICLDIDSGAITDVMEIDAASNNGVENIRDLIDSTVFTPVRAKYRVYIMDEVHMLSTAASNAFLKTLEEPREHVIFILATTDPHKVLPTVRSRCQKFDFKRIQPDDIAKRLAYIAKEEGLILDEKAASLIVRIADGALRDAVSLLDLCASSGKNIGLQTVNDIAGIADKRFLFDLTEYIRQRDAGKALILLADLYRDYIDMAVLSAELIDHLRSLMIIKTTADAFSLLVCTKEEFERLKQQAAGFTLQEIFSFMSLLEDTVNNMAKGYNKRTELELALIRLCAQPPAYGYKDLLQRVENLENSLSSGQITVPQTFNAPAEISGFKDKAEDISDIEEKAETEFETPETLFDITPLPETENTVEEIQEEKQTKTETDTDFCSEPVETAPEKREKAENADENGRNALDCWDKILKIIFSKNPVLWAFLEKSITAIDNNTLYIYLENPEGARAFLEKPEQKNLLFDTVFDCCSIKYKIEIKEAERPIAGLNKSDADNFMERIKKFSNND